MHLYIINDDLIMIAMKNVYACNDMLIILAMKNAGAFNKDIAHIYNKEC